MTSVPSNRKNLALVGFMGTGKSHVGRIVADQLDFELVDMDAVIEERAGKPISRIFEEDGEPAFRKMETEVAMALSERSGLVVAAGGGVVLNPRNMEALAHGGVTVCLKAEPETVLKRVEAAQHRPLLEDGEKAARIRDLLAQRRALYEAVPLSVDTDNLDPDAVAVRVLELYRSAE